MRRRVCAVVRTFCYGKPSSFDVRLAGPLSTRHSISRPDQGRRAIAPPHRRGELHRLVLDHSPGEPRRLACVVRVVPVDVPTRVDQPGRVLAAARQLRKLSRAGLAVGLHVAVSTVRVQCAHSSRRQRLQLQPSAETSGVVHDCRSE